MAARLCEQKTGDCCMFDKLIHTLTLLLSCLALALAVTGIVVYDRNAAMQQEVAQMRQQTEAARSLTQLYQGLAQAIAGLAKDRDDKELTGLLAGEGLLPATPATPPADLSPRVKNFRKASP